MSKRRQYDVGDRVKCLTTKRHGTVTGSSVDSRGDRMIIVRWDGYFAQAWERTGGFYDVSDPEWKDHKEYGCRIEQFVRRLPKRCAELART